MSLRTSLTDSLAILGEWRRDRNKGTNGTLVLRRVFDQIDARSTDTLVINAPATRTNPKADNQTYSGTWQSTRPTAKAVDDRSCVITEELVRSDSTGLEIVYYENCDTKVTQTTYFDRTMAQVRAIDDTYATSTAGKTVNIDKRGPNDLGLFDVVVTVRERQLREYENLLTRKSTQVERREWHQHGITSDTTIRSIATRERGKIKSQEITELEDCSKRVITSEDQAIADSELIKTGGTVQRTDSIFLYENLDSYTESSVARGIEVSLSPSLNQFGKINLVRRVSEAQTDTMTAANAGGGPQELNSLVVYKNASSLSVSAGADGQDVSVSASLNPVGKIDYSVLTRTARADSYAAKVGGGPQETDSVVIGRNITTLAAADRLPGVDGTIKDITPTLNPMGRIDYTIRTRTAVADSVGFSNVGGGPNEAVAVQFHRNKSSVSLSASPTGTVLDVSPSFNPFGRLDYTVRRRTAVANSVNGASGGTVQETDSTFVYVNADTIGYTAGSRGKRVDVSASLNEFGKVNSVRRVTVAQADTLSASNTGGSVQETVQTAVYKNATSVNVAAGAQGIIEDVSASLNPYGRIDYTVRTRTAVADSYIGTMGGGPQETDSAFIMRNRTSMVITPGADGTIKRVSGASLNAAGLLDYSVVTTTAVADSAAGTAGGSQEETVALQFHRNKAAMTLAAPAAGSVNSISGEFNRFGKFDYTVRARTAVDNGVAAHMSVKQRKYHATRTVYRNSATAPELTASDTFGEVSYRKNEFGRYDGDKVVYTYTDGIGAGTAWSDKTGITQVVILRQPYGNTNRERWCLLTVTYNLTYHSSPQAAYTEVSGGYSAPGLSSRVRETVRGVIWEARKVTAVSAGAWQEGAISVP